MKNIQLRDDVYQRAAELAESDHVSVDRLVAALVNEGGDWSKAQASRREGFWRKAQDQRAEVR